MNSFGNVVGITTLMLRGGQNLNYAVPVRYLRPLVKANEPPRRYARNLLPSASTGLAAIETPTRETRGGRAPSRDRGTVDVVAARFRTADSLVRTIGGAPVSQIVRGRLENREWSQHPVTLVGGHEYVIAGYCDQDCTDLDLVIYTPAGTILDSDTDYDDYPKLRFVAPESGSYQLTVTMASCETNPCAYGIRLYRVQAR